MDIQGLVRSNRLAEAANANAVRLDQLEQRVGTVDTEAMVARKLIASKLPDAIVVEMARELKGQPVSETEVDQFIGMQKRVVAGLGGKLARTASVDLEGSPLSSGGTDSVEARVAKLMKAKKYTKKAE